MQKVSELPCRNSSPEAVSTYRAALATTPILSADGQTATFKDEDRTLKVTRMSNGKWGFHR